MLDFVEFCQTKIFFSFPVAESQTQLHFLGAGHWKLQPNPGKLCFAIKVIFLQAPQQKPEKLSSKSFSMNFVRLNLQKQWPVEVAIHVAVLKVQELFRQL